MPRMTIRGLDETEVALSRLAAGSLPIAKKAVKAGADIVADKVRANLTAVLSGESSGELLDSLGITPVDTEGWYVNAKVGFDGYDSSGTANALKGFVLEYGSEHQPPRPYMKTAANATKAAVKAKMEEVVQEEINKIMP